MWVVCFFGSISRRQSKGCLGWEHLNSNLYLVDEDIWRGKFTIVIQRHDGMSRSVFVERKEVSIGQKEVLGLFSPPVEEAW